MHALKKNIPNFITVGNLIFGLFAILFAFYSDLKIASFCIFFGAFLDFFDGLSARILNVHSELGKQLDSMADIITFGIGSGLAGVAGVAVSLLGSVGPNVGGNYIVGCFMVVVLGGVGNLLGTILASFGIGIMTDLIGAGRLLSIWPEMPLPLSNTINFFATTSMARVMIFALIVIFLQFKPTGLFPQKGRMVEN